jgi:hypothetical protein
MTIGVIGEQSERRGQKLGKLFNAFFFSIGNSALMSAYFL